MDFSAIHTSYGPIAIHKRVLGDQFLLVDRRGGEKGPNIATRAEISRRSNDDLVAILKLGVPAAGMPAFSSLGDAQLQAVVRHLRALQGLNAKTEVAGDAEEGRKLFLKEGSCASCHMINGAGG